MAEPLSLEQALELLHACVREIDRYNQGSPAQATFIRSVLPDTVSEVLRACDAEHPPTPPS